MNEDVKKLKYKLTEINKKLSNKVACFTGHRPQKLTWHFEEKDKRYFKLKNLTKKKIKESIRKGYDTFITGMALGFDIMCAELILELKKKHPNIKIIGALPCKTQSLYWNNKQKKHYEIVLNKLDKIRCIYDSYIGKECMLERNRYMVNNSSLLIAFYLGYPGGTEKTIEYAKKQGLKIEIIEV